MNKEYKTAYKIPAYIHVSELKKKIIKKLTFSSCVVLGYLLSVLHFSIFSNHIHRILDFFFFLGGTGL
jgi:hypothetical protein